jgi:hypothetical protein
VAASWSYANDARILRLFLGGTLVVLGIVAAIVASSPTDPETAAVADVLLAMAIFLLIFGILVFVPRVLSRGSMSYSLHVERSLDDVESTVREAVEAVGRSPRVEVRDSRLKMKRPPRTVRIDGVPTRILLRAAPYRERRVEGTSWSEIVLVGLPSAGDEFALELRKRISAGFARA